MTSSSDRCINPSEIRSDDLIAYAQGEASPAAKGHIERCPSCQGRAQVYAKMDTLLSHSHFRRSCVPSLTLGEYALGLLEPAQMREVAEHLLDCPHCLAESRTFSAFFAQPDEPLAEQGIVAGLRRLIARRIEAPSPALAGLRGTATDENVTYAVQDSSVLIHLTIQSAGQGRPDRVITGFVEQRSGDAKSAVAKLYHDTQVVQTDDVDDLGNFFFPRVPQGTHRLELTTEEAVILLEGVEVR